MEQTIVKCIFESLDIIQETGASLNTFQDLLVFACHMFCRGRGLEDEDQMVKAIWPHDWETAKMYLVKLGYQDAKEYYICLDDSHKRHWGYHGQGNRYLPPLWSKRKTKILLFKT